MNNEKPNTLKTIMDDQGLTPTDVSEILGCSVWTVYHWRTSYEIPDHKLELLQLKLAARDQAGREAARV